MVQMMDHPVERGAVLLEVALYCNRASRRRSSGMKRRVTPLRRGRATPADAADEDRDAMSRRIERVIVDECIGPATTAVAKLRRQSGVARAEFVFLAVEHPGIPDAEILDKLLDAGSVLLTGDRVLHNLALGRGFRSFVHTPETGLTDRRLAGIPARDRLLPVSGQALQDSWLRQPDPAARAITGSLIGLCSPVPRPGRPAHRPFRGLLSVHSRCGLHTRTVTVCRNRYPKASDTSSPPCLLRSLPAGAVAGWGLHPLEKRRLVTAHVESGPSETLLLVQ